MIENVQIRATKLVDGLSTLDYPTRLLKLNLPTLKHRRERGAMIEMYKHFNLYSKETLSEAFQPRERFTRPHNQQLLERAPKDGATGTQSKSFISVTRESGTSSLPRSSTPCPSTHSKTNLTNTGKTFRQPPTKRRRAICRGYVIFL